MAEVDLPSNSFLLVYRYSLHFKALLPDKCNHYLCEVLSLPKSILSLSAVFQDYYRECHGKQKTIWLKKKSWR